MQALLRENHELRQEMAKTSGVDPSKIRSGRKVCVGMGGVGMGGVGLGTDLNSHIWIVLFLSWQLSA